MSGLGYLQQVYFSLQHVAPKKSVANSPMLQIAQGDPIAWFFGHVGPFRKKERGQICHKNRKFCKFGSNWV